MDTLIVLPARTFRLEFKRRGYKPWVKEITVAADSELTLDATLSPGQK